MSAELKRALLQGAKTEIVPKHVEVSGIADLAAQMAKVAEAQTLSNLLLAESLDKLVATIENKDFKATDVTELTAAVRELKNRAPQEPRPNEWVAEFEYDRQDRIKSGVRLVGIPPVIN